MNHAIGFSSLLRRSSEQILSQAKLAQYKLIDSHNKIASIKKLKKKKKKNKETHTINIDKHVIQLRYIPITESCSSQHAIGF